MRILLLILLLLPGWVGAFDASVRDAALGQINTATRVTVTSAEPADFAGIAAVLLASKAVTTPGSVTDSVLTLTEQLDLTATGTGSGTHYCFDDGSVLLGCTTLAAAIPVSSGMTVDVGAMTVGYAAAGATVLIGNDDETQGTPGIVNIEPGRLVYYEETFNDSALVGDSAKATGTASYIKVFYATNSSNITSRTLYGFISGTDGTIDTQGSVAVTSADQGTWVTIPLDTGISIASGTNYVVAVGGDTATWAATRNTTRAGASDVYKKYAAGVDLATITTITNGGASISGPLAIYVD